MNFDFTRNEKQAQFFRAVAAACDGASPQRYFFYGGGVRGGKTSICLATLLWLALKYPGARAHIVRESQPLLFSTVRPAFDRLCPPHLLAEKRFSGGLAHYRFKNGSVLHLFSESFAHDPDLDRFKGLETNFFLLEQAEELQYQTFVKCLERVGSWRLESSPPGVVMATFNPAQNWVKTEIRDKYLAGLLPEAYFYLEALPSDNPFVTGEQWNAWKHMDPLSYRRFVEGDWTAFENEKRFAYAFDPARHVVARAFVPTLPVYLSFDFNVEPFCATAFQTDRATWAHATAEFRIERADVYEMAAAVRRRFPGAVFYLTGDASGRQRSALTAANASAYTILTEALDVAPACLDVPIVNPSHRESRVFVNALLSRWNGLSISPECPALIEDLSVCNVDERGRIVKSHALQTHLLDTFRYFLHTYFAHLLPSTARV